MAALAAGTASSGQLLAAEVDPVALVWTAPATCPSSDTVHDQVEKTLGVALKDLAPVAAVVTVAQGVGRWQASMILHSHGQRAERAYEAESCDALATATALIVALAAEGQDRVPPAQGGTQPSLAQHRDREKPVVGPEPTEPLWRGSSSVLQLSATFDDGTLPYSFAPGIEANAGRSWDASIWRLRFLGGASYFATQAGTSQYGSSGDLGNYWLLTFAARGCVTAVLARLELGPCFGGELAVIHGSDVGTTGSSDSQYWLSPIGGLMAELALERRVSLIARTEVVFPTTLRTVMGQSYLADGADPVYTIPSRAIRVAVGLELRFF